MKRLLLWFATAVAGLLLVLGVLVAAPFTEFGTRMLLQSMAGYLPVKVKYASGSLMGGLQLSRVHLETETLSLEVLDVDAQLKLSCLWRRHICFEGLSAGVVDVVWDGGSWHSGKTLVQGSVVGSTIIVDSIHSADALLTLRESAGPDKSSGDTSVKLPVGLMVHKATLEGPAWDIYGSQYQHEFISFRGQWLEHVLELEQVEVGDKNLGVLNLSGQLTLSGEWPFELAARANWPDKLTLADVLEPFTVLAEAQSESLAGIALLQPWMVSVKGTAEEQTFSVETAANGLGYEALQLSLFGRHSASADAQSGQTQLIVDDLKLRDEKTDSDFSGSGELLLGEQTHWKLSAQSNGFSFPPSSAQRGGRLAGTFESEGSFAGDSWSVALSQINLQGQLNDLPARIEGQINVNELLQLSGTRLTANVNGADLQLTSRPEVAQGLDLQLSVAELGRWLPDSRGTLDITASISQDMKEAHGRASVQNFQWQEFAFKQGDLRGKLGLVEDYGFNLEAVFSELAFNSVQLESLDFSAVGSRHKHALQLVSRGDMNANLTGEGVFSAQGGNTLSLAGEVSVHSPLLAEGYDLSGKLKLGLEADWNTEAAPRVAGELLLLKPELRKELGGGFYARESWDRASLQFKRQGEGIQLNVLGVKAGKNILRMSMTLPGQKEEELSGEIAFHQLDIQDLQAFVPTLSSLRGTVNGKVMLSGTGEHVLGHGEIELVDGSFAVLDNPTQFEAFQLQLTLQGDKADITGGLLLGGGQLDITGRLGYLPEAFIELQLIGERETLLFPPSVQLQVSHSLKVVAGPEHLDVTGELIVHEGVLEHEQLPEGGVALSEDVVLVGDIRPRLRPFDLAMNVQVTIENRFKVVGSVVDATVGGDLHLLQERRRPLQLFGNLNVVGGELRAYGEHLKVKQGTVAFSGAPENPTLDIRAERTIPSESITVGLELQGTLEDPILDVYSDPAMARTEVLSYLVRGRGLDSGAGADGAALALSMGASVINQTGALKKLDKLPGINSVEFGAEGANNDTTATVSGYIGNRIYLSYGVGLYEPINVLTARLYLQTRLWLEVVSSLENSLDLYYSFDIE